jgi:CheY-like chemotaxis protein
MAENGAQALEMVDCTAYDLIFMDVRMPVMNGCEATRLIRARGDDRSRVPILAVTAEAANGDASECLESGMNLHLSKPLRINDLVVAINSLQLPLRQTA